MRVFRAANMLPMFLYPVENIEVVILETTRVRDGDDGDDDDDDDDDDGDDGDNEYDQ